MRILWLIATLFVFGISNARAIDDCTENCEPVTTNPCSSAESEKLSLEAGLGLILASAQQTGEPQIELVRNWENQLNKIVGMCDFAACSNWDRTPLRRDLGMGWTEQRSNLRVIAVRGRCAVTVDRPPSFEIRDPHGIKVLQGLRMRSGEIGYDPGVSIPCSSSDGKPSDRYFGFHKTHMTIVDFRENTRNSQNWMMKIEFPAPTASFSLKPISGKSIRLSWGSGATIDLLSGSGIVDSNFLHPSVYKNCRTEVKDRVHGLPVLRLLPGATNASINPKPVKQ